MSPSESFAKKNTAACLAAAALFEIFPKVRLLGGGATSTCFFYDFSLPVEWKDDFLVLIEERMYAIVREKKPVRSAEMVPSNAASFLRHLGLSERSGCAQKDPKDLVTLLHIGSFADMIENPFTESLQLGAFALEEAIVYPSKVRLIGLIAEDKQKLKHLVKGYRSIKERDHLFLGSAYFQVVPEWSDFVFLPKGEKVCHTLLELWRKAVSKKGYSLISTPPGDLIENHKVVHRSFGLSKTAELRWDFEGEKSLSLLSKNGKQLDSLVTFCHGKDLLEACISCLQFIQQILNIFNFECRYVLCTERSCQKQPKAVWQKNSEVLKKACELSGIVPDVDPTPRKYPGPAVEVLLPDVIGKEWGGPHLTIDNGEANQYALVHSLFGSLQQVFALLLEQKNELPFWLAPVQVKVLALGDSYLQSLGPVLEKLRMLGIAVECEVVSSGLSQKVYEAAAKEKVPYVLLYGEKEEKTGQLSIRTKGQTQSMTLPMLEQRLLEEQKEVEI